MILNPKTKLVKFGFPAFLFLLLVPFSMAFGQLQTTQRYLVQPLKFPNGKEAITVAPDGWKAGAGNAELITPSGKRLILESEKSTGAGACEWTELAAKFIDFPTDKNLDLDIHQRNGDWFKQRGADDACLAFIISGRASAVIIRAAFRAGGMIYCLRTERLFWTKDIDGPGFVALEKDINLISSYFFLSGADGYKRLKDILSQGGGLIDESAGQPAPPQPAGVTATATAPNTANGGDNTPGVSILATNGSQAPFCASATAPVAPRDADLERADRYKNNGKYSEAEAIYRGLLERSPYDAYTGLGDICVGTGRYPEAMDNFKNALRYNPNGADAFNGLGSVYFYQQDWRNARDNFNKALQADPKNPVALSDLGWIALRADKDLNAAQTYFVSALEAGPDTNALVGIYSGLSAIALNKGDIKKSISLSDELLSRLPDNAAAYTLRANVLLANNDPASALTAANRATEISPGMHQAWALAGAAAFSLSKFEESAADWQKASENAPPDDPANINYYLGASKAWASAGNREKAIAALQRGVETFPDNDDLKSAMDQLKSAAGK